MPTTSGTDWEHCLRRFEIGARTICQSKTMILENHCDEVIYQLRIGSLKSNHTLSPINRWLSQKFLATVVDQNLFQLEKSFSSSNAFSARTHE